MIKVVKGNPTPEELAAALAVVRARAAVLASAPSGATPVADAWSDPARVARRHTPRPGPGAWGRTYWPA
ncbi:acyl-CoA carboxylase subunit epsilon [Streptomyces sp. WAC06614]|uniref:acyl-CoA carboxylase subunit epsilon n=1 Tax=Streptomyces sp. WAC06614 TaxID=2487416 RepID=UPI000F772867|nr:acyl-CoA carboxylase subunit epsilon [Streptomyces sp. WAC06614]RSS82376.1 acyl-CoA carboxylase subunit epsilon [Streptomyces sp. WAC06614]